MKTRGILTNLFWVLLLSFPACRDAQSQAPQAQKEDCGKYREQVEKINQEAKALLESAKDLENLGQQARRGQSPSTLRKKAEETKARSEAAVKEERKRAESDAEKLIAQAAREERLAEKGKTPDKARAYHDASTKHRQLADYVMKEGERKAEEIMKKGEKEARKEIVSADLMEAAGVSDEDKPEEVEKILRENAEVKKIEARIKEEEARSIREKYMECQRSMKGLME